MRNETEQIFLSNDLSNQATSSQRGSETTGMASSAKDMENISKLCRICAASTEFIVPIFEGEGFQNNLAEKIQKHLPIKVTQNDSLPHVVCVQCASTVLAWHELVVCCVQADEALKTRLAQDQNQPSKKLDTEHSVAAKNNQDDKLTLSENVPVETRSCAYCNEQCAPRFYNQHLLSAHCGLVFRCDECHSYVDKRIFVRHMALHAVRYNSIKEEKKVEEKPKIKIENQNKLKTLKENNLNKFEKTESITQKQHNTHNTNSKENLGVDESEFSDHSDTSFDPLPNSVFEAIEDTEDIDLADNNARIPLNEHVQSAVDQNQETEISTNTEIKSDSYKLRIRGRTAPCGTKGTANVSKRSKDKERTCPTCGKIYTASSSYFYHVKYAHKSTKEFKCDECGKLYNSRANLNEHAKSHTEEGRRACKVCGKTFTSRTSLYIHKRIHSGVKKYVCGECGVGFLWQAGLIRHSLRHGARSLSCPKCDRLFAVRSDLLRHLDTHSASPRPCPYCGQVFAQRRYLKVHIRNKHPNASPVEIVEKDPGPSSRKDILNIKNAAEFKMKPVKIVLHKM